MNELVPVAKMSEDQERYLTAIIKSRGGNLPMDPTSLKAAYEFTDGQAKMYEIVAAKAKEMQVPVELWKHTLKTAQRYAGANLFTLKKIGDLSAVLPRKVAGKDGPTRVELAGLPEALWKTCLDFAKYPEAIEQAIRDCKDDDDVPNKAKVREKIAELRHARNQHQSKAETPDIHRVALDLLETLSGALATFHQVWKERKYLTDDARDALIQVAREFGKFVPKE
jgi:hypothetical protein